MIGDGGLTDGVSQETDRALDDHELIKVRVNVADRAARQSVAAELAAACGAQVIQQIGKVCVLYRANPKANAKLSNLARHGVKVAR